MAAELPIPHIAEPVAVDTTGSDLGISALVEGAVQAYLECSVRSFLVGPGEEIKSVLKGLGALDLGLPVIHAPDVIEMHESPGRAVRRKPDSALCVAYRLVQSQKASSIISAGNSGAMMAAGRLMVGLLAGIERPAIAALIPCAGQKNPTVILDSGANVDSHALNLAQFAVMGSVYSSSLFGKRKSSYRLVV